MIQVLEANKKPSTGQKFSNAIGAGLQMYSQMMQPTAQEAIEHEYKLRGKLEEQKQAAKFANQLKLQEEKQDYLSKLFGGKSENQIQHEENKNLGQREIGIELPQSLNAAKVSDEDIARATAIDPALGNALSKAKDVALREQREETKAKERKTLAERKEEIEFHKESQKYDEEIAEKSRRAKSQVETFSDIEKAINSGNVKPASWTNILRNFGETGNRISNAIMNKDEATVLASIPQLLEGWKQVFGVRLTDADLRLLQDKLPDIGKNPEANKSILKVMKKYGEMSQLRSQIASDIKKQNKGLRPIGYADRVEERFDEMTRQVKVINPKTGNTIEIPAYKVSEAIKAGASLANE